MTAIPSGTSEKRPTRITGTDSNGRCTDKPELWGSERAARIIDLTDSRHVELSCLEITDHSSCIEHHCHGGECAGEVVACKRDAPPFGDWAGSGIHARNARDVVLTDVDVHGLAVRGLHVGGARDWHLERVRIVGNGWSGWDGDLGEGSSNSGVLRFVDVEIAWNGCGERWPSGEKFGCWAQQSGGYGDGLGTAETAGHWIFEGGSIHHNTSDGLDLLYLRGDGRLTVDRLHAYANAGNQIKASGNTRIRSARIDGNCGAFGSGVGIAGNMQPGDHCRALGNAVVAALGPGARVELSDNDVRGNGDCLVVVEGGDATAGVLLSGNRFEGAPRFTEPGQKSCGFYAHKSAARIERNGNSMRGVR